MRYHVQMAWSLPLAALLSIGVFCTAGCSSTLDAFHCERDQECIGDGRLDGQCELNGFCSFADSDCGLGGRRFGKASAEVSNQCVGVQKGDAGNPRAIDAARADAPTDLSDAAPPPVETYVFSTCGQSRREGPTQAQCDTDYAGTSLEGLSTVGADGIQTWTVPADAIYEIRSAGAGHNSDGTFIQGALIQGNLQLQAGTDLRILVGQQGRASRGGNGGSFVTLADNMPLVIAGGAGGQRGFVDENNRGSTSTAGQSVVCDAETANGGTDGQGGEALGGGSCSGAGGGLLGTGQGCGGGQAFVNGGLGGAGSYDGGFGGAGGVNSSSSPGGGGGYSGGAVTYGGGKCAGGGGSFLSVNASSVATSDGNYDGSPTFNGAAILSLAAWNIGEGSVVISQLGI